MHERRFIAAFTLLAAFAVGGVLGPAVHPLKHARQARSEAAAEFVPGTQAGTLTERFAESSAERIPALKTPEAEALPCWLCTFVRHGKAAPASVRVPAANAAPIQRPPCEVLCANAAFHTCLIRGPPVSS